MSLKIIIDPEGDGLAIYDESLDLSELGSISIQRASHVEPTQTSHWTADLSPVGGPMLGPYAKRSDALRAEVAWLEQWLARPTEPRPTGC